MTWDLLLYGLFGGVTLGFMLGHLLTKRWGL